MKIESLGTCKVILSGSSPYPTLSVDKPTIDYGNIVENSTKKDTVKVVNRSINTLWVFSIYTKTADFISNRTIGTVRSDTLTIVISFTPTALSRYSDTLYLKNNSQSPLVKIPLSGITSILPVELIEFSASQLKNRIILNWKTATEVNNYGFEIERRKIDESVSQGTNVSSQSLSGSTAQWLKIGFVSGNGTSSAPHAYSYSDEQPASGRNAYRLKQIDNSGAFIYSQSVEAVSSFPGTFSLSQNYPNPFNPSTTIQYALPKNSWVKIHVFNILGQMITELVNSEQASGYQSVVWSVKAASGMYYYRIEATDVSNQNNRFVDTKKMILLK
jgi:hypothetical protein